MKRLGMILLLFWLAGLAMPAQAQQEATTIEQLTVDLWPDFDQPSVLVLLTGKMPASTPLPATVTLPIPAGATLHAVARVSGDGTMIDDVQYTLDTTTQMLHITLPDLGFRVEYYQPYERNDLERHFTFAWQMPASVQQLLVSVQQPAAATSLTVSPSPVSVTPGNNGLQYHNMPAATLSADQPYTLDVNYTMSSTALTTSLIDTSNPIDAPATLLPTSGGNSSSGSANTTLLIGAGFLGVLVIAGIIWLITNRDALAAPAPSRRRRAARPAAPRQRATPPPRTTDAGPAAPPPARATRFCHDCGQPSTPDDRFCRYCGTELKR